MSILTSSMQSLKTVQLKLKESKESLDSVNDKSEGKCIIPEVYDRKIESLSFFAGKPILVPLTSSVSTYDFSTIFWDSFWGGQGVIIKYHLQQYHLRIPLF